MRDRGTAGRAVQRLGLILVPVLAVIALVAWGYSSAVGSSPDDDFHLTSIWCGGDSLSTTCTPGKTADERTVPNDLLFSPCFAYKPKESASCQGANFGVHPDVTVSTDRGNFFAALYPPVFYFVTSTFAGPNIDVSVLAIRIFNSILFVGMVTLLWFLLPVRRRPALIGGLVVTAIPLAMSLIPSTNPSSWAILSAGTLWVALLGYFETTGWRRIALGAFALVATLIGAGARSDSAVYAVVAVGVAVVLTARRDRGYWLSAILAAAVVGIAIAFFIGAHQSDVISTGFVDANGHPLNLSPAVLFAANTLLIPGLWVGIFGLNDWGIGWLDTPVPIISGVGALLVFAGAVFFGLRRVAPRRGLALWALILAAWIFPTVIMVQTRTLVGSYVQPRYILPLLVMFAGVLLLREGGRLVLSIPQRAVVLVALSIANAMALAINIRRYVTGTDVISLDLNARDEWWWPGFGLAPMTVWIIGSLAFAGMLILIERRIVTSPPRMAPAIPWRRRLGLPAARRSTVAP